MKWTKPPLGAQLNKGHPLARGLVGAWLFNEGAGALGKAFDLSGNGNHGTLVGNTHSVPGKFGNTLSFDGAGDYVTMGDVSAMEGLSEITVSAWDKQNAPYLNGDYIIVSKMNPAYAETATWALERIYSSGTHYRLRFTAYETDGSVATIITGWIVENGQWHNAVGVFNGTHLLLYEDGVEVATPVARTGNIQSTDTEVRIGTTHSGTHSYNGSIDDVMIWNRALTAGEIMSLYQEPFQMFQKTDWALFSATMGIPAAGIGLQMNIGDAWKQIAGMQINIGDSWKAVIGAQINIGDDWKEIF